MRSKARRCSAAAVAFATLSSLVLAALAAVGGASTQAGAVLPPMNLRPPAVTGTAQVGRILGADPGKWRGHKWKPSEFSFQWRLCSSEGGSCGDIPQATDRIYAVRPGDVAHTLRVVVTASNTAGAASALSRQTKAVRPAARNAPFATVLPAISGQTVRGAALVADAGAWANSPVRIRYQWRRCNEEGGACNKARLPGERYKLKAADVGHAFRVLVTAENSAGRGAALSLPTEEVTPSSSGTTAPKNRQPPTIIGNAQQGQTLRATTGSWSGTGPFTFSFQWLRCGIGGGNCGRIAGATEQTYVVRAADVRRRLRVRVTAGNAAGASSAVSASTRVVAALPARPAPPRATGQPAISGPAIQGSTLTTSTGSWSGTPPLTFQYRWLRCDQSGGGVNGVNCATIPGETRKTLVLVGADVGHRIRSRVIATNKYGTASFNSNASGIVQPAVALSKPQNTSPPTISGSPIVGQSLRAGPGSWTGGQPITYAYQWRRCDRSGGSCSSISGAVKTTYTLKTVDMGTTLRVQVTARNASGVSSSTSVPTAVIARAVAAASAISINDVALPNRLIVDRVSFRPFILRSHRRVIARFRVADSNKRAVQGALVAVIGIPFGRVSTPPEQATGPDGYATFALFPTRRLVLRRGGGIVFFVRARKPGERLIGGVSTRRLVFLRVGRPR